MWCNAEPEWPVVGDALPLSTRSSSRVAGWCVFGELCYSVTSGTSSSQEVICVGSKIVGELFFESLNYLT